MSQKDDLKESRKAKNMPDIMKADAGIEGARKVDSTLTREYGRLVASTADEIYALLPRGLKKIIGGLGCNGTLAAADGRLLASDDKGVYDVLTGDRLTDKPTQAFCMHEGELYYVQATRNADKENEQRAVFKVGGKEPLAKFRAPIRGMVSHDKKLYAYGGNFIFNVLDYHCIANRADPVLDLLKKEDKLVDGGKYGVYDTLSNQKLDRLDKLRDDEWQLLCLHNGEIYTAVGKVVYNAGEAKGVAERGDKILFMCSSEGELWDGSGDAVFNTLQDRHGLDMRWDFEGRTLTALIAVDEKTWDEVMMAEGDVV